MNNFPRPTPSPRRVPINEKPDVIGALIQEQKNTCQEECRESIVKLLQQIEKAKEVPNGIPFPDIYRKEAGRWNNIPNIFVPYPNGKFDSRELTRRKKQFSNGTTIYQDVGPLSFVVVKPGATLGGLKQNLGRIPGYAYLREIPNSSGINSFNIPPRYLQQSPPYQGGKTAMDKLGIPIPIPEKERQLSEEMFANYCYEALAEMESHPHYGPKIKAMIKTASRREVVALMIAVAKKECGERPIGQFVFHRYEPHHKAFSFSLYHILMTEEPVYQMEKKKKVITGKRGGPGRRAQQELGLTIGQTYHPKNACKLFLAFLIEKRIGPEIFPLQEKIPEFVKKYNGVVKRDGKWGADPIYVKKMEEYLQRARKVLASSKQKSIHLAQK